MSFLDNAQPGTTSAHYARAIEIARDSITADQDNLVEITVQVRRLSTKYREAPFVLPASALSDLYALAETYMRSLDVLHVEFETGNPEYGGCAFLKVDEMLVIEILRQAHKPEPVDEVRRSQPFN